jgi:arginyl-tRNA synthetase
MLEVLIVQLTTLYRGSEQLRMSTRKGQYITLRQLIDEVGVDAARYFFARRKTDSHLDFDLELAKKQTPDNPVFYVQYAGARINSIVRKAVERYPDLDVNAIEFDMRVIDDAEKKLIKSLYLFPEKVADSARCHEPQKITLYLEQIAGEFQSYYSSGNKIITDDKNVTFQKVKICQLFKQVVANGLNLLGINIPDRM